MASLPNVVLVHGAWADGSSWSKVITPLQDAGYHVTAVQMPLSSVADDVAATRGVLELQDGPTVLVGHSYGGAVLTAAATGVSNVSALVYIAAFVPDEGETLQEIGERFPSPPGVAHLRPDSRGYLWLETDAVLQYFAPDVDPVEARVIAAVQKPIAAASFGVKAGVPAWKTIPSWYLVSENDQMISPDLERFMAERCGATTRSVASSHVSLVSHPAEVVALIEAAAQGTAR